MEIIVLLGIGLLCATVILCVGLNDGGAYERGMRDAARLMREHNSLDIDTIADILEGHGDS